MVKQTLRIAGGVFLGMISLPLVDRILTSEPLNNLALLDERKTIEGIVIEENDSSMNFPGSRRIYNITIQTGAGKRIRVQYFGSNAEHLRSLFTAGDNVVLEVSPYKDPEHRGELYYGISGSLK